MLTGVAIAFALMTLARWFDGAKRVWIDDDVLVVAAYGKEVPIPLAKVGRISQARAGWPIRITVAFRDSHRVGTENRVFPAVAGPRAGDAAPGGRGTGARGAVRPRAARSPDRVTVATTFTGV